MLDGLAHEIWSVAQLLPGEGILDGVNRIKDLLGEEKTIKLPTWNEAKEAVNRMDATAIESFIYEYERVDNPEWRALLAEAISEHLPHGHEVQP